MSVEISIEGKGTFRAHVNACGAIRALTLVNLDFAVVDLQGVARASIGAVTATSAFCFINFYGHVVISSEFCSARARDHRMT